MNAISETQRVQNRFADMLNPRYSVYIVTNIAEDIRASVKSGKTTWEELEFTEDDVAERLRRTKVRVAIKNFAEMSDPCYSIGTVETFARDIRDLEKSGETTWRELGFADNDVAVRLRKAKVRTAKVYFADMSEPFCPVEDAKHLAICIRTMVLGDEVRWEELELTNEDVAKLLRQAKARAKVYA